MPIDELQQLYAGVCRMIAICDQYAETLIAAQLTQVAEHVRHRLEPDLPSDPPQL